MIHLVLATLVTRPGNLDTIATSIEGALRAAQDAPHVELSWQLFIDTRHVSELKACPYTHGGAAHFVTPTADWAGEPYLRNYALDVIQSGHIAWLDDDNLLDTHFIARVAELLNETPDAALVFDQRWASGQMRLSAAPHGMVMGSVDTAQVVAPRDLYGDLRFRNVSNGTDGFMYEALHSAYPERFRFINEPRVLYNALG